MKKNSAILSSIVCIVACFYFYISRTNPHALFDNLAHEDKTAIELLLKDLVFKNDFGYALIGEKPVSISGYFSQEPFENFIFTRRVRSFNFERSWKILEKFQSELNTGNFLIFKEKSYLRNDIEIVTIINKQLFLSTVEEHISLFKKTLGNWTTPDQLLTRVSKETMSLFAALHHDEGLYGILLGYGRSNALAFKRKWELARAVDPLFRENTSFFSLHFPKPSLPFHSLEEEYTYLEKHLSFLDLSFPFSLFAAPAFVVIEDQDETFFLKQKYRKSHRKLMQMYSGKNFLQVTLNLFLS